VTIQLQLINIIIITIITETPCSTPIAKQCRGMVATSCSLSAALQQATMWRIILKGRCKSGRGLFKGLLGYLPGWTEGKHEWTQW